MSLYGAGENYTLSGETTLDDDTLKAEYDIAVQSTLMGAVIKLRGKHIVASGQLTLLDNTQSSVGCSAGATYSEYSDVTQIVISPQGSNAIGGAGSAWKIEGSITIDDAVVDLYIGAPAPEPSLEPALPVTVRATAQSFVIHNVAESSEDVTSCLVYIGGGNGWEILGLEHGNPFALEGFEIDSPVAVADGVLSFSFKTYRADEGTVTKIVVTTVSHGVVTFE